MTTNDSPDKHLTTPDGPELTASDAQREYDANPDLQALLGDAAQSPTVKRNRRPTPLEALQDVVAEGKTVMGSGGSLVDDLLEERHRDNVLQAERESDRSKFGAPEWQAGEQEASAETFLASIGFGPLKPEEAKIAVQAAIHAVEAHRFAEDDGSGEPVPRPEPDAR